MPQQWDGGAAETHLGREEREREREVRERVEGEVPQRRTLVARCFFASRPSPDSSYQPQPSPTASTAATDAYSRRWRFVMVASIAANSTRLASSTASANRLSKTGLTASA